MRVLVPDGPDKAASFGKPRKHTKKEEPDAGDHKTL
jgi:hypothetical protein